MRWWRVLGEVFAEAVGLVEGEGELLGGDLEADVAEVVDGGEAMVRDLVDVEGELGLDVLVFAFGVVDDVAVACRGAWETRRGRRGWWPAEWPTAVADVVGEGADGEGELVGVAGIAEEVDDEVARTDVVGEVGEELVAEGVVADVLDDAAAVGVGAGVLKLRGGEGGIAAEEQRNDGGYPR